MYKYYQYACTIEEKTTAIGTLIHLCLLLMPFLPLTLNGLRS